MKIETNNDTPMHMPSEFTEKHHSKLGPMLGLLFVVLVGILGGLYLWGGMLKEQTIPHMRTIENNEPETLRAETDAEIMSTVSSSDSIEAIEADVESTNLESLDAELNTIELELQNGLTQ